MVSLNCSVFIKIIGQRPFVNLVVRVVGVFHPLLPSTCFAAEQTRYKMQG